MKEITLREMQSIELEILREFVSICNAHKLRFYIDGGTLLGAYCYGGFIPWDDDIDIKMPRPDYDKLAEYRNEFSNNTKLVRPEDDNYQHSFTKMEDVRTVLIEEPGTSNEHVGCVYIDVLPMDGHGGKELCKIERYKTLFHISKDGFPCTLKGKLYSLLYNPKVTYRKMTLLAKRNNYDKSEFVGLVIDGDTLRETYPRTALDNYVYLDFEGMRLPAPSNYLEHLSSFYNKDIEPLKGNLPRLPSGHNIKAFWKE